MNPKDVGDALLNLELSPPSKATADQIGRIMDADRRRVRRWMWIAVLLWIVAAIGAFAIFIIGGLTFPFIAKLVAESGEGSLDSPDTPFLALAKLMAVSMVIGTASFVSLVTAGLSTVLLLVCSRRATLRQINSNLLEISEQLKHTSPVKG